MENIIKDVETYVHLRRPKDKPRFLIHNVWYGLIILFVLVWCVMMHGSRNTDGDLTVTLPAFPIDVVYTWAGEDTDPDDIRVAFNDELKYSLRSVYENMPWVNHIYIIMNPPMKKPSWFNDDYGAYITILDHHDVYTDSIPVTMPVTESNNIETALHNIPGLSDHFLYMNDDFIIGRPLSYESYFTPEGLAVLNPRGVDGMKREFDYTVNGRPVHIKLPPKDAGWAQHTPHPLNRKAMKGYVESNRDWIELLRTINTPRPDDRRGRWFCDEAAGLSPGPYSTPCLQQVSYINMWMRDTGLAVNRSWNRGDQRTKQCKGRDCRGIFNRMPKFEDQPNYFNWENITLLDEMVKGQGPSTYVIQSDPAEKEADRAAAKIKIIANFKRLWPNKAPFED